MADHWHLVTYGLTELDAKESGDASVSGWGFELSMRVEPGRDGKAPEWTVNLLTNLAAYVWTGGHPFAPGHHVALGGPIDLSLDSALTAAAVCVDPAVGELKGPFGVVETLQVVGLTADELELCRSWSTDGVLGLLAEADPLLITRPARGSILEDPARRDRAMAAAAADGASLTELRVATLRCRARRRRVTVVELGSGAAAALGPALRRELIADGASFEVIGDDVTVRFRVGSGGWTSGPGGLDIPVPLHEVGGLADLFDGRKGWGRRPVWSRLRFHVVA